MLVVCGNFPVCGQMLRCIHTLGLYVMYPVYASSLEWCDGWLALVLVVCLYYRVHAMGVVVHGKSMVTLTSYLLTSLV